MMEMAKSYRHALASPEVLETFKVAPLLTSSPAITHLQWGCYPLGKGLLRLACCRRHYIKAKVWRSCEGGGWPLSPK